MKTPLLTRGCPHFKSSFLRVQINLALCKETIVGEAFEENPRLPYQHITKGGTNQDDSKTQSAKGGQRLGRPKCFSNRGGGWEILDEPLYSHEDILRRRKRLQSRLD